MSTSLPASRARSPRRLRPALALLAALAALLTAGPQPVRAQAEQKGHSGFPLPRFASIKSHPVNVRLGPSKDHDLAWTFMRAGIPVEITQEFDIWFRIRDSEGQEGWVQKTFLSGRRTALVLPWEKSGATPMRDKASADGAVLAILDPNVVVDVMNCDGKWCRVTVQNVKGWLEQGRLWGVYPDEKVE